VDPNPHWIRIQWLLWIRIQIEQKIWILLWIEVNPDPQPNTEQNTKKIAVIKFTIIDEKILFVVPRKLLICIRQHSNYDLLYA
jgi:hypothetical protein